MSDPEVIYLMPPADEALCAASERLMGSGQECAFSVSISFVVRDTVKHQGKLKIHPFSLMLHLGHWWTHP